MAMSSRRQFPAEKGICHMQEDTITQRPDPSDFSTDPFTDVLRDGARKLIEQAIQAELAAITAGVPWSLNEMRGVTRYWAGVLAAEVDQDNSKILFGAMGLAGRTEGVFDRLFSLGFRVHRILAHLRSMVVTIG